MKLRSGKVLNPVAFKQKREVLLGSKVTEMIVETTVTGLELNPERVKELKCFFSSLFYHCCKNIGHKEWVDELERTKSRRVTCDEIFSWKADESFWKEYFQKIWFRMRCEIPRTTLLQAFEYFINHEYNLKSENPEGAMLKSLMGDFLCNLYYQNNITCILF